MAQSFKDFAKSIDHLIVGSHPPKAIDIENLFDNYGVRAIENLQERSEDSNYITAIKDECVLKNIWYQRVPVGFLNNKLQHFQITAMNHVKKLYYLKEIIFQSNELLIISSINT
jgi:spore maturation protein CgeB